jgi:hypothetical protein
MSNPSALKRVVASVRGNVTKNLVVDPNQQVIIANSASSKRSNSEISSSTVLDASSLKQATKKAKGSRKKASEPNVELPMEVEEVVLAQSSQVSRFLAVAYFISVLFLIFIVK